MVPDLMRLLNQMPLWRRLRALPGQQEALEERIAALETAIEAVRATRPAPPCPLCGQPMKPTIAEPALIGATGRRAFACSCGHAERRAARAVRVQ